MSAEKLIFEFFTCFNDQTNWSDLKQIQHLKILTLDKQTPDSAIALDFKPTLKAVHYTTKHHTKFSGSNLELTGTNEFISLMNRAKMLLLMDRLVFALQSIEFQCRGRSWNNNDFLSTDFNFNFNVFCRIVTKQPAGWFKISIPIAFQLPCLRRNSSCLEPRLKDVILILFKTRLFSAEMMKNWDKLTSNKVMLVFSITH